MSCQSNVVCWLAERGWEPHPELVQAIFARAKKSATVLTDDEILAICREHGQGVD